MSKRGQSAGPTRQSDSLADVVEMLLDKGVVINADIVVSIGDTELLGVQLRAAIASFETAAEYGLEFPEGTDMRRVEAASGRSKLPEEDESDTVQTAIMEEDEEGLVEGSADGESDTDRQSAPEIGVRPNTEGDTQTEEAEESSDGEEDENGEEESTDDGD